MTHGGKIPEPTYKRRATRERIRALIEEAKSKPCADCKQEYVPQVMELHHFFGVKRFAVSGWQKVKATEQEVIEEIAKCIVLCPTCHKLRHCGY